MTTSDSQLITHLSNRLWDARTERRALPPLTREHPGLSVAAAYEIAWEGIQKRQAQGEEIIGYKMGLTSKAKREQMNLKEPIYGVLTNKMRLAPGQIFPLSTSIHPKAEPEIAFHLNRSFSHVPSPSEAFDACDLIAPAIEILDSRFEGFKYFSLPDVIADNSSSSHFIIGEPKTRESFSTWQELANIQMDFFVDGKLAAHAKAAEISGNPILSVVALTELLLSQGRTVPSNIWILAGAATPASPLSSGTRVVFDGIHLVAQ